MSLDSTTNGSGLRIAYISPYQGPTLAERRPIQQNLGLAANVKVERIAELLYSAGSSVEIFSLGEIRERRLRHYPGFSEPLRFHNDIPVYYASALPARFVRGLWSGIQTCRLLRRRNLRRSFDLVILYNLNLPQIICASYAIRSLSLPVVLEYEDDAFVDIKGRNRGGLKNRFHHWITKRAMTRVSGCLAVSPLLLSRMHPTIPTLLIRGVVSEEIVKATSSGCIRQNWVVYSGAHTGNKGLKQLITAWRSIQQAGWELHIAGVGEITSALEKMAEGDSTIVFHGLLNRDGNAHLLAQARIGMNPHDLSQTPGNVFAFKIIEYLAAGTHCITTPMGVLEPEIEAGLTYIEDNTPETIAAALKKTIQERIYERLATAATLNTYGAEAVATSLSRLLQGIVQDQPV